MMAVFFRIKGENRDVDGFVGLSHGDGAIFGTWSVWCLSDLGSDTVLIFVCESYRRQVYCETR